jgi:hypothetical protein
MSFKITGPGYYRQRDGGKAEVSPQSLWSSDWDGFDSGGVSRVWEDNGAWIRNAAYPWDLVAPWTEEPVVFNNSEREQKMNKSQIDAKQLEKDIDSLPICADGKKGVKRIIEGLGLGVKFDSTPELCAGQVYKFGRSLRLIVKSGDAELEAGCPISGINGAHSTRDIQASINDGQYTFVANNLQEYLEKNGGKL